MLQKNGTFHVYTLFRAECQGRVHYLTGKLEPNQGLSIDRAPALDCEALELGTPPVAGLVICCGQHHDVYDSTAMIRFYATYVMWPRTV
jgi:hypothetical protein